MCSSDAEFLAALEALGGDAWFQLGDRDLATHVIRTQALREGATPGQVAVRLASALGLRARLAPAAETPAAGMTTRRWSGASGSAAKSG